jgi:Zn-finger nucleic acid-binding protein
MNNICPLCATPSNAFYEGEKQHFMLCPNCKGIFRDRDELLHEQDEKERYLHHKSDVKDMGYFKFVSPIIEQVKHHFDKGARGLDFGCGHTPVLSEHLKKEAYTMSHFDPIFFNDTSLINSSYDFIVCCEVMEHFFYPFQEFKKLYKALLPNGKLICKTHLFEEEMDFDSWYYKNDPSHVFIYQHKTIEWIKDFCYFKEVKITDRVITFSK